MEIEILVGDFIFKRLCEPVEQRQQYDRVEQSAD
jgi:hypothetical protein